MSRSLAHPTTRNRKLHFLRALRALSDLILSAVEGSGRFVFSFYRCSADAWQEAIMKIVPFDPEFEYTGDNGGRRSGLERRTFSYTYHVPERRSGIDRRSGYDRRQGPGTPRDGEERRAVWVD